MPPTKREAYKPLIPDFWWNRWMENVTQIVLFRGRTTYIFELYLVPVEMTMV